MARNNHPIRHTGKTYIVDRIAHRVERAVGRKIEHHALAGFKA
jgi:hypothetical protein